MAGMDKYRRVKACGRLIPSFDRILTRYEVSRVLELHAVIDLRVFNKKEKKKRKTWGNILVIILGKSGTLVKDLAHGLDLTCVVL